MHKESPKISEFCWNELMASNTDQAKEFYQALFGWNSQDHDLGDSVYTLFKMGDKNIGGMMQIPAGQEGRIPAHWMSYISVENLEQTVAKAQTLGAVVKVPPKNAGEFGRFAVIIDPSGAHIALWQSSACK